MCKKLNFSHYFYDNERSNANNVMLLHFFQTPTGSLQLVIKDYEQPVKPYLLVHVMNAGDVQEKEFYEYFVGPPNDDLFTVPQQCL